MELVNEFEKTFGKCKLENGTSGNEKSTRKNDRTLANVKMSTSKALR